MAIRDDLIKHLQNLKELLTENCIAEAMNHMLDSAQEDDIYNHEEFQSDLKDLQAILAKIPVSAHEIDASFIDEIEITFFEEDFFNYFNETVQDLAHNILIESKTLNDHIKQNFYRAHINEAFNLLITLLEAMGSHYSNVAKDFLDTFLRDGLLSQNELMAFAKLQDKLPSGSLSDLIGSIIKHIQGLGAVLADSLHATSVDEQEISSIICDTPLKGKSLKRPPYSDYDSEANANNQTFCVSYFKPAPEIPFSKKPKVQATQIQSNDLSSESDEELKLAIAESLKSCNNKTNISDISQAENTTLKKSQPQ